MFNAAAQASVHHNTHFYFVTSPTVDPDVDLQLTIAAVTPPRPASPHAASSRGLQRAAPRVCFGLYCDPLFCKNFNEHMKELGATRDPE